VHASSGLRQYGIGKFRRLGIPFIAVTTIYFILDTIKDGTPFSPATLMHDYLFSHNHLWFLQSIMWIFFITFFLDKFDLIRKIPDYLFVLGLALVSTIIPRPRIAFLGIGGALPLIPFFLLGLGIYRFQAALPARRYGPIAVALLITLYVADHFSNNMVFASETLALNIFLIAMGFCSSYTLLTCRWHTPVLAWLGAYAFEAYLFHLLGTAGSRMALHRLHVENLTLLFCVGVPAGLLIPVWITMTIRRLPALNFLSAWLSGTKVRAIHAGQNPPASP
jgi:peptidoglycan/LPS O-acetylase OafA/YrhL